MKKEWTIAILNKVSFELGNTQYKSNTNYRVSFDEDGKGCIVFGEWMNMKTFEANFIDYVDFLQKKLAIILGEHKVSFASFKKIVDIHTYGHGRKALKVMYIGVKENRFGFYPMQGNKADNLKECYEYYVRLFEGNFEVVDEEDVRWGNCGIPLAYSGLRREIWNDKVLIS